MEFRGAGGVGCVAGGKVFLECLVQEDEFTREEGQQAAAAQDGDQERAPLNGVEVPWRRGGAGDDVGCGAGVACLAFGGEVAQQGGEFAEDAQGGGEDIRVRVAAHFRGDLGAQAAGTVSVVMLGQ